MTPTVRCPECNYEIETLRETVEALEGGGKCLLCGSQLDRTQLEIAEAEWEDDQILAEGRGAAEAERDLEDEDQLFDGVPDFGDEGEDDSAF